MEGTQAGILDVHGDLLVLLGVRTAEQLATLSAIDVKKTTSEGTLGAPEHVELIVLTLLEGELEPSCEEKRCNTVGLIFLL